MTASQAIAQVQAQHPDSFIVFFGEDWDGYDIGVYKTEADNDADVADNDNGRMVARTTVAVDA